MSINRGQAENILIVILAILAFGLLWWSEREKATYRRGRGVSRMESAARAPQVSYVQGQIAHMADMTLRDEAAYFAVQAASDEARQ